MMPTVAVGLDTDPGIASIDTLCAAIEAEVAPEHAERIRDLVRAVLELHRSALVRALDLAGAELRDRLAADDVIGAMLVLHDLHPQPPGRRIGDALLAHGDRLARFGVVVEAVAVDAGRARITVVGKLAAAAEAEIASIALAAAPDVEAVDVIASGAALVPLAALRAEAAAVTRAAAAAIARTVLYEGYLLYPYRTSNVKNQRRWTLGAVLPRAWCTAAGSGDRWQVRTELVVRGDAATRVGGAVRFLVPGAGGAVEHELELAPIAVGAAGPARTAHHRVEPVEVEITREVVALGGGLWRVAIAVANTSAIAHDVDREAAAGLALGSAHVVVDVDGGALVSLIDPPADAADAAAGCRQDGLWPALLGPATAIAASIVLPDHPELAPESPGDLFDATEIDEILILRVLTMTDAEKREARAGDPRVAALLDRCEALGPEQVLALHGRRRGGAVAHPAGTALAPGDRVILRPGPRGDVLDTVLAGRAATVASIEHDVDGRIHVAVTVDDDPGRDLGAAGYPGHRFFFSLDEVEPR